MVSDRARYALATTAFLGTLLLASGCESPTFEPRALQLWATGGDAQLDLKGSQLVAPLVVRVTDGEGRSVPGVAIDWAVEAGGGSLSTSDASFRTDDSGMARAVLTLGPQDGINTVSATAHGAFEEPTVTFMATAVSALVETAAADMLDYACVYDAWYGVGCLVFDPEHITTTAGSTIGWRWPHRHNITFEDDPSQPTSSPTVDAGTHTRSFAAPGTYRYRCTLHSLDFDGGMVGTITVQ